MVNGWAANVRVVVLCEHGQTFRPETKGLGVLWLNYGFVQ